jgi:hypothetical protein
MVSIRIEVDRETDLRLRQAAAELGRSKRRHASVIARRWAKRWDDKRRGVNAR